MSTAGVAERPPTPPRSNDGENGLIEVESQLQHTEPFTPPPRRSILLAPKVDGKLMNDHGHPQASYTSHHPSYYGDPSLYQTAAPANNFYPIQQPRQNFVRTTQLSTPPAAYDEGRIHTRSGRELGSPSPPNPRHSTRIANPPRSKPTPKASKKSKAAKNGVPLLDQPLSILTKDYSIPLKDMDLWVHRPVSERLQQASKNKDHISRPMNSFMLYRSAYADRAKHFCKENNHQVVSQVTGASWPLEPQEVREMYEEFARIERDAHHNAHPNYKFAPNKKGTNKRSRFHEDDDDDPEWEGSRQGKSSRTGTSGPISRSQSPMPYYDRYQPQYNTPLHPSSFWASNPHGQPPAGMGPESYYQPVVDPYNQGVEEVGSRRMHYPPYEQTRLVGMPNNAHPELLAVPYAQRWQSEVLDPQLAAAEQQYQYSHYETADPGFEAPRTYEYGGYPVAHQQYYEEQPPILHPGMVTFTDNPNAWDQPGAEFDQVLERWP